MSVIALENLSVSHRQGYELRTVVHEVNLRIEPGECFGLVGPSGCGKSSLLWVLAGLNGSWQGGFELLGRRLQPGQAFTGELRREVQMVFQDPCFATPQTPAFAYAVGATQTAEGERHRT